MMNTPEEFENNLTPEELEEMLHEVQESGVLPFQLAVYFPGQAVVDASRLMADIDSFEPGYESRIEVSGPRMMDYPAGGEAAAIELHFEDTEACIWFHEKPSADENLMAAVKAAPIEEESRSQLLRHQSHAVLTLLNEEDAIEGHIALLKIGFSLVRQGAIGFANPWTGTVVPAELAQILMAEPELWPSLREDAYPTELLVSLSAIQEDDGSILFFTQGMFLLGLSELITRSKSVEELPVLENIMRGLIGYMQMNAGTIGPGDTFEMEDRVVSLADGVGLTDIDSPHGVLLVQVGT